MPVERAAGGTSLIDVLDRVLDKGIVIDAWVRVSLVGIDLITVEARIVVASIDTYLKYSEAVGQVAPVSKPAIEGKGYEEVIAENAALRAQLKASPAAPPCWPSARRADPRLSATGRHRTRASRACASRSRAASATTTSCSRRACACSKASSAGREIADCAQLALQWLGEVSASRSRSAWSAAGEQALFVVAALRPRRLRGHSLHRVARRLEQPARHRVHAPQSSCSFPRRAHRRRPQAAPLDAVRGRGVSRRAARRRRACRTKRSACCWSAARRRCRRSCAGSPRCSARSSIRCCASRR